jgi:crotonobetainyl-CoA:carnitine CoA-transferase CaiB-like acyl-CoA transferase
MTDVGPEESTVERRPALEGVRVLDISHQYSGALAACMLGDLGADVLAVEHPRGSPIRTMLPKKDGESIWWKVTQRGKRTVTLDLSTAAGQRLLGQLVQTRDVLIENFRPGRLEAWGLGPADLGHVKPDLVFVRISGYGQTGSYRSRPGYGTAAEALSGFAHLNGFPDGPPALPSVTLADGVTAIFAAVGALAALRARDAARAEDAAPRVEIVDAALLDSLVRIIPNQATVFQQLGIVMNRLGNSLIDKGVLRDLYLSRDRRHFVIGGGIGTQSMAKTLDGVSAPDLRNELLGGVLRRSDEEVRGFLSRCNKHIHSWASERDFDEIQATLLQAGVVFAPIYGPPDLVADPHVQEREVLVEVSDADWQSILMPAATPRLAGRHRPPQHAGRAPGADNETIYRDELGLTDQELRGLIAEGIV